MTAGGVWAGATSPNHVRITSCGRSRGLAPAPPYDDAAYRERERQHQQKEQRSRIQPHLFDLDARVRSGPGIDRDEIVLGCEPVHHRHAELKIAAVAQATGLMTVALSPALDTTVTVVERLRAKLVDLGGSVVALQVPNSLRGGIDVWDCNSDALPLMREIKRRFDPNRILNPGRFVGNI